MTPAPAAAGTSGFQVSVKDTSARDIIIRPGLSEGEVLALVRAFQAEQVLRCYPSGKDSGIPVACSVTCGEQPIGTWTLVESSGCKRDGVAVGIALA